jgi:hypothetical protein
LIRTHYKWIACFAFFTVIAFAMFGDMLWGERVLLTTDAAITGADKSFLDVFDLTRRAWSSATLLGSPGSQGNQVALLLNAFIPDAFVYNNTVYLIACLLSSIVLLAYLYAHCGFWPSLVGALAAFWVGSNFTLLYAGHNHKPYALLFFLLTLLLADQYAKSKKSALAILIGASAGLMFCQQQDVAAFYAIFAAPYILVRFAAVHGKRWASWLLPLSTVAVVALLFAGQPLLSGYNLAVKDVSVVSNETPEAKWNYITQWSCPPGESIDFIAPGYTGWRSGDSEGPYWGIMGQSPEWKDTQQGFANFKLESTYIGVIPFILGCFAFVFVGRDKERRVATWIWGGIALLSLLLAFGKFFPLYKLFTTLPVVSNIRNPNKFIQIFQLAVGVLSAYGISALLQFANDASNKKFINRAMWITAGTGAIIALSALGMTLNLPQRVAEFVETGWPKPSAEVMAQNRASAMWHAALMALLLLIPILAQRFAPQGKFGTRSRSAAAAFLAIVLAVDAIQLSRHYIKAMPKSYVAENGLIRAIKEHADHQRIALPTKQGVYGIFSTYMFPFHKIETFNAASSPRLAGDYEAYFKALGSSPIALWRNSAVGLLVGPMQFAPQLAQQHYAPVYRFDVSGNNKGGISISGNENGQHALYKSQTPGTRFLLVGKAVATTNLQEHASALLEPGAPFTQTSVSVAGEDASALPTQPGIAGTVEVVKYRPGRAELAVVAERDCVLRFAERYDPRWSAVIDGEKVPLWRADMISQAMSVSAGKHTVVLNYHWASALLYAQLAGVILTLWALVSILRRKPKNSTPTDSADSAELKSA